MKNLTTLVSIESVLVSRNYRTTFDQESLQELAQSIKQHGIIQALTVRPHPVEKNKYELIAGKEITGLPSGRVEGNTSTGATPHG
jgi:hypothetical protein